jgi:hypothetical protein
MISGGGLELRQGRYVCNRYSLPAGLNLTHAVSGENESEIMKLVRSIPKETGSA